MAGKRKEIVISQGTSDPVINIILDTIEKKKQALVFVNSKRGAESQAEQIAHKLPPRRDLDGMAERVLAALSSPTKQCHRLALCVRHGMAFHHAGLHHAQREIVEEGFRAGHIWAICATPTLAQGLDMPAFRTIIRDLKRYGQRGMTDIAVLEYEQMAGRAGRPGKESFGEAICIAKSQDQKELIIDKFLRGSPEEIYSKLAVEPVLRTYVLSLIASGFVATRKSLFEFFDATFYAAQFQDVRVLHQTIDRMLNLLFEWGFIEYLKDDFQSADKYLDDALSATPVGKRVSELYVDPFSASYLIGSLKDAKSPSAFGLLFLTCRCLELRPYLNVGVREYDTIISRLAQRQDELLEPEPSQYGDDFEEFLQSFKTSLFLDDWIDERDEEYLMETFAIRPGEIHAKLDIADWILFCAEELSRMLGLKRHISVIARLRLRLKYGVRDELLALLRLKGVGRVRARKLYESGIKDVGDMKKAPITTLARLVGPKVAQGLKGQVGEPKDDGAPRRSGQSGLGDFA
ncbi:MAG: helicase-related protein [Nanoarchaeota archaeon]